MTELLEVYERHSGILGLKLEIYHSSIVDWRITIEKRMGLNEGELIVDVQGCDFKYVLSKAEVVLKDWLSENDGGY